MATRLSELMEKDPQPDWHIGARCGIHPSVISRYKTGEREIPNKHAQALSEYFSVSIDEIRGRATVDD